MALMRGRFFPFMLALLSALALMLGAPRSPHAAPPADGSKPASSAGTAVLIRCATEAADVYLDGDLVGKTPLKDPLPMSPGEHTVRVARPGFAPFIDVFKIKPGQTAKLDVELVPIAGVLSIVVGTLPDPPGLPPGTPAPAPRVFVDEKYVGQAPIEHEISPGNHSVRIERPGFVPETFQVTAVAGKTIERQPALVALPPDQNPYLTKPKTKWYQKWWVWTIGAVGVAAIATAIIVPVVLSQRTVCTGVDLCASTNTALITGPSAAPATPSLAPALTIRF